MGHVEMVLTKIKAAGLTANTMGTTIFLGHFIGGDRVSPSEHEVQAVWDFAPPSWGEKIPVGLTGYYCRFIQDYAAHSVDLTEAIDAEAAPYKF